MNTILDVKDLVIHYETDDGCVYAVNGLDLDLQEGETLGLVGETGAGKTTLARGIMGLVPDPPGRIRGGQIIYRGTDLLRCSNAEMRKVRGRKIAMIFQDPMTSLNPVTNVGLQIAEAIQSHEKLSRKAAMQKACQMLEQVGIPAELTPLLVTRPFSGSASLAVLEDLLRALGPDSLPSLCACVLMGSSDTAVYVLSVYFSAVGVRRSRYALPCALAVMVFCVVLSCLICRLLFA